MRRANSNHGNMQFPFMREDRIENADANGHIVKHKSESNRPLCQDDRVLFDAIFEVAQKRGTRLSIDEKEQWIIAIGHCEIVRITNRSESSVRRLIKRLIEHGYIKVECEAKGGTEATIYRVIAPAGTEEKDFVGKS